MANAWKPLWTDGRKDGRTDGRTDGPTDGRTCRKTVTVRRVDQRTHVQVKIGYFRLRTDGRTTGKHNASGAKGGGIKMCFSPNRVCLYILTQQTFHSFHVYIYWNHQSQWQSNLHISPWFPLMHLRLICHWLIIFWAINLAVYLWAK